MSTLRKYVGATLFLIVLLGLIALAIGRLMQSYGIGIALADETRTDISLTEAQSLVPFTLCLPTYLPAGIEPKPQVIYHADFGDPQGSDIRLNYSQSGGAGIVVEIYQRHAPGRLSDTMWDNMTVGEVHKRELLAWLVGWPNVDKTVSQVRTNMTIYQDDKLERGLLEIVEPVSLRAYAVIWGNSPVFYKVYARSSAEETQKIASSLSDCANTSAER